MITYLPAAIIAERLTVYAYNGRQPHDYLPLYEHFARKLLAWNLPCEFLVDTSGIHLWDFGPLRSQEAVKWVLAKLFACAGRDSPRGKFLRRCGLRKWADLAKPIRLRGRQSTALIEYDVRERRLREPGPNQYHPGAVYAKEAFLRFRWDGKWEAELRYGYSNDASSWSIKVLQRREALSTFVNQTVPRWLAERLEPEEWPENRRRRNKSRDRLVTAVDSIFSWDSYGRSPSTITTDALVADLLDKPKPLLTGRRLGVLRRWMAADAAKEAKRHA